MLHFAKRQKCVIANKRANTAINNPIRFPLFTTLTRLKVDVKWIHWRSATAGMVVKLDGGRLLTKLFCLNDCKSAYTGKPVDQIVESERSERS